MFINVCYYQIINKIDNKELTPKIKNIILLLNKTTQLQKNILESYYEDLIEILDDIENLYTTTTNNEQSEIDKIKQAAIDKILALHGEQPKITKTSTISSEIKKIKTETTAKPLPPVVISPSTGPVAPLALPTKSPVAPPISSTNTPIIILSRNDWGVETKLLTDQYNTLFTVLNMANENRMGGGVMHGAGAQEENMFRRSDCMTHPPEMWEHIITQNDFKYTPELTDTISSINGKAYLDDKVRYCFKSSEIYCNEIQQKNIL